MIRSKKYAFVAFCLLAQGVRANGIVKHYPATIIPVIDFLMKKNINIVQMMCPELIFDGFIRKPCGKLNYDTPKNRKIYKGVAEITVNLMDMIFKNGHNVNVIIGVDFSPSCAVNKLSRSKENKGIFIEELFDAMQKKEIQVPFIGVEVYKIRNTLEKLEKIF